MVTSCTTSISILLYNLRLNFSNDVIIAVICTPARLWRCCWLLLVRSLLGGHLQHSTMILAMSWSALAQCLPLAMDSAFLYKCGLHTSRRTPGRGPALGAATWQWPHPPCTPAARLPPRCPVAAVPTCVKHHQSRFPGSTYRRGRRFRSHPKSKARNLIQCPLWGCIHHRQLRITTTNKTFCVLLAQSSTESTE